MKTDEELQRDVIEELEWDPQLRDVHTLIGVAVQDGVVTLTGVLGSFRKKLAAENAALRIRGVKVVATDIEVATDSPVTVTDTDIANAIRNALRWNSALTNERIDIKVDNGWVILNGEVDWAFQKDVIRHEVEDLHGVKGIINAIIIKNFAQTPDSTEITKRIGEAFERNSGVDADAISISVSDNTVMLCGVVRSWAERQEAERIAWSSPGVKQVDNRISIGSEIYSRR